MALKAQVTAEEYKALNPVVQQEYAPIEGQDMYQLTVEEVGGLQLADVSKLQSALDKERSNARAAMAKAKQFEGLDPTSVREALEFKARFDKGELTDEAKARLEQREKQLVEKYEAQRAQLMTQFSEKEAEFKKREQDLFNQLKEAKVTSEVRAAIATHNGIPALLEPLVSSRVRLVEEDGKLVRQVIGDNGQPLLSRKPGAATEYMSVDEFVGILKSKPEFAGAFKGSGSSGGGSGSGSPASGGAQSAGGTVMITSEQAKDVAFYRQAREAAAKAGKTLVIAD